MSENRSNNPARTGTNGNNSNQASRNRYSCKTRYQSNKGSTNSFRGKVTEMNGNVFQLATERKKKDQFDDTLEALKIYASTKFAEDIAHLDPLFRKLKRPTVAKPVKSEPTSLENEDGTTTVIPVDPMDADIYKEIMKKYDKKVERFEGTLRALYNVFWGQTNNLKRNQLQELTKFETIKDKADVTALLKEIKKSCHEIEKR